MGCRVYVQSTASAQQPEVCFLSHHLPALKIPYKRNRRIFGLLCWVSFTQHTVSPTTVFIRNPLLIFGSYISIFNPLLNELVYNMWSECLSIRCMCLSIFAHRYPDISTQFEKIGFPHLTALTPLLEINWPWTCWFISRLSHFLLIHVDLSL